MKKFTLNDLKTGHVVKLRSGECGLVMRDMGCVGDFDGIVIPKNKFMPIYLYKEDMTSEWDGGNRDIMEVYRPCYYPNICNIKSNCVPNARIWMRK